ncbi:hypothetical protein [Dysgonomonas macrotermitis]|uniref:Uncharacterized protein n=1 Tax=Dysgonomonas macrotermitis TaxID=1346286 RepID=A0A1M5AFR0_9BACT|nr:hypothetical protein [Dysgonomonas macrotermitis]SHF29138.1 hypothetical protein SAMN05444362_10538 [Dysgonomonas macrotermitis]
MIKTITTIVGLIGLIPELIEVFNKVVTIIDKNNKEDEDVNNQKVPPKREDITETDSKASEN